MPRREGIFHRGCSSVFTAKNLSGRNLTFELSALKMNYLQIILKLKCFGEKSTLLGFSSIRTYFKWPTSELNEARVLLHYRLIADPPGVVFVFLFSLIHTATEMLPVNLMNYYYAAPKLKINQ